MKKKTTVPIRLFLNVKFLNKINVCQVNNTVGTYEYLLKKLKQNQYFILLSVLTTSFSIRIKPVGPINKNMLRDRRCVDLHVWAVSMAFNFLSLIMLKGQITNWYYVSTKLARAYFLLWRIKLRSLKSFQIVSKFKDVK